MKNSLEIMNLNLLEQNFQTETKFYIWMAGQVLTSLTKVCR